MSLATSLFYESYSYKHLPAFLNNSWLGFLRGRKPGMALTCFFSKPWPISSLAEQILLGPDSGHEWGSDTGSGYRNARRAPALLYLQIHWGDQNASVIAKPCEAKLA